MNHLRCRVRLKDGTVRRYRTSNTDSLAVVEQIGQIHKGQIVQLVIVMVKEDGVPVEEDKHVMVH